MNSSAPVITVRNLTMAYGNFVLQRDLNFTIDQGDIFVIMGGSGCGKSTLLRHMIGLKPPAAGSVWYGSDNFWELSSEEQASIIRKAGVLYQSGALWSSMTLAENVALPLQHYTDLEPDVIAELVTFKLSLVGLAGFEEFYPVQLSGGMRKRAALARAIAMDPDFLFFDEPSAGLDPISSRNLDQLILELRESLRATVIIVTHELASIYAIATNSVFLDSNSKTMLATGDPKTLLQQESTHPTVLQFLTRGTGKREVCTV
ncbi:MAG: ATP-binding cassette domain-containing protein [Desulfobulbus sp.]|nr:ATP-binding cassette domain-containing protein [Desulfobulbus sp.]